MIERRKKECTDNVEFKDIHKEKDNIPNLIKESQHFIIRYTELDKTCIEEILDVLENSYNRITNHFNEQIQEKLTIEVHSGLNELHIALGFLNAPDWVRGGLGVGKIVIASSLNPSQVQDLIM